LDKTKLPRSAHAERGDPKKKSTWKYPHHWVKNGEVGKDEFGNEVYISGDMYLHKGGLDAAWSYANGARTGEKAKKSIRDHLQAHRKALGLTDDNKDKRLKPKKNKR
jgi:hypothetical protein